MLSKLKDQFEDIELAKRGEESHKKNIEREMRMSEHEFEEREEL